MLYLPLCSAAYDIGIGHAWPYEIDELGPKTALQLSYTRAIEELLPSCLPDLLYVDGRNKVQAWDKQQIVEPKADNTYIEVSAASIIAKVFRDTIMEDYARTYPNYNWKVNKGYGTPDHIAAIFKHGLVIDLNDKSRYLHRQRFCTKILSRRPGVTVPMLQQVGGDNSK